MGHLLVADPAPLSFKTRGAGGGLGGGVAYKDPARPPPPPPRGPGWVLLFLVSIHSCQQTRTPSAI